MIYNHDIRTSKQYPYGYFCKCGTIIHLGRYEVAVPETRIECKICGYKGSIIINDDSTRHE